MNTVERSLYSFACAALTVVIVLFAIGARACTKHFSVSEGAMWSFLYLFLGWTYTVPAFLLLGALLYLLVFSRVGGPFARQVAIGILIGAPIAASLAAAMFAPTNQHCVYM